MPLVPVERDWKRDLAAVDTVRGDDRHFAREPHPTLRHALNPAQRRPGRFRARRVVNPDLPFAVVARQAVLRRSGVRIHRRPRPAVPIRSPPRSPGCERDAVRAGTSFREVGSGSPTRSSNPAAPVACLPPSAMPEPRRFRIPRSPRPPARRTAAGPADDRASRSRLHARSARRARSSVGLRTIVR